MKTMAPHHGNNVRALRELKGIKQATLAEMLKVSQQTVSSYETKEVLDRPILEQIAKALEIPVAAIENFSDDRAFFIIANTFSNTNNDNAALYQHHPVFNAADKLIEVYNNWLREKDEEILRLRAELEKFRKNN